MLRCVTIKFHLAFVSRDCSTVMMGGGHGAIQNGKRVTQAGNPTFAAPQSCMPELGIPAVTAPDRMSLGTSANATFSSYPPEYFQGAYWFGIGESGINTSSIWTGSNPVLLNTQGSVATLLTGLFSVPLYTLGQFSKPLRVPMASGLVGTQLTIQGALWNAASPFGMAVSNPSMLVVVP